MELTALSSKLALKLFTENSTGTLSHEIKKAAANKADSILARF